MHGEAADARAGHCRGHGQAEGAAPRTTVPDVGGHRPADLLERDFTASSANRRWVADITYVDTLRLASG